MSDRPKHKPNGSKIASLPENATAEEPKPAYGRRGLRAELLKVGLPKSQLSVIPSTLPIRVLLGPSAYFDELLHTLKEQRNQLVNPNDLSIAEIRYAGLLFYLTFRKPKEKRRIPDWLLIAEGFQKRRNKGGAPKKSEKDSQCFLIGQSVEKLLPRFLEWMEFFRRLRASWPSQPDRWRGKLRKKDLTESQIEAVISRRNPLSATIAFVAHLNNINIHTAQNSYSRYKKLSR